MQCPKCLEQMPEDDVFCEGCGFALAQGAAACACGAGEDEIDEDGFCERCGRRVLAAPENHMEESLGANCAAVSDRGLRHERNEDRFVIRRTRRGYGLVVCDGVSSSRRSEEASALAAKKVAELLADGVAPMEAIAAAQQALSIHVARWSDEYSPSTTVVAALVERGRAAIGWVGDSRAYWIGAAAARQLTADHSWVNSVVASGEMSAAEAGSAPQAHGITRWLGADAGANAAADAMMWEISESGILLLCSDGLWNYAPSEDAMARAVRDAAGETADALDIARRLVRFAIEAGGHDNVTAVALRIGADGEDDG